MLYISKGIVCPESVEGNLFLGRGKQKYQLQGREASLWLRGSLLGHRDFLHFNWI